jgi:hypothetical protein
MAVLLLLLAAVYGAYIVWKGACWPATSLRAHLEIGGVEVNGPGCGAAYEDDSEVQPQVRCFGVGFAQEYRAAWLLKLEVGRFSCTASHAWRNLFVP